ncbi:HD domain-containing phosphohydrolase [Limnospira platensis]|uniref:HD domain-containing phosphohydrolase n=1 Tax=Limnospira platensis TaxID=118562 RepID=UPI00028043B8|nr:metal dependent phosphohydrolase [Arthrospira platensis C1]UWU49918.1 HD domain-containing protein [Arthrospira platensis C1]
MVFDNLNVSVGVSEESLLIEKLLDIGTALSGTLDLGKLLNLILSKSREITCSDAGSVYLVDYSDDRPKLLFKVAQNQSLPNLSFREFAIALTDRSLAGHVALTGKSLNIDDAYDLPQGQPYRLDRSFDENICYRTRSVLVLPMQNREGETLGVLQLINRKLQSELVLTPENTMEYTQPYSDWEERILRSLASQAAISIERSDLQESIELLFEGFVKTSVQVIEARDPCTFGHSERVAVLTVRLGEEINQISEGPLAAVQFSDRQLQELRYAALLHDFGKVGVPEAVLNKAKKLYPWELEIMKKRFAIARQSLQIDCLQRKYQLLLDYSSNHSQNSTECPHCQTLESMDLEMNQEIEQLQGFWEMVLEANEPEILPSQPLEKLHDLSKITYRDIDGKIKPLVTPEEIEQLLITQGNLTASEREIIEGHVTHTYNFLKQIPWTKGLENVPQISYGHHEKVDGSGYPLGLKKEKIPLQSQMMAIADIYDALTAGDRPYKHGLLTVTALKILRSEAAANKINGDILTVFEQRQVYESLGHTLDVVMELA